MLAVMSFNGYIGIALIIGSGIGYWIFGPTLIELNLAKFVPKRTVVKCEPGCSGIQTVQNKKIFFKNVFYSSIMLLFCNF